VDVRNDDPPLTRRDDTPKARDYPTFFREAWPALMRLAFARVGDVGVAEDIVQDVLADAHRKWGELAGYDDPLGWARRAVLNRSISRWRRLGNERRAMGIVASAARSAGPSDIFEADAELWNAVRSLPRRQRDVALLLWFEDLPARTVASILGCGEDTVRTHWRRARVRLADRLTEREGSGTGDP
jgi:RNA polymerase sigma factor (sigma-70 family)